MALERLVHPVRQAKPSCRQELSDRAVTGQVGAGGSSNGAFIGAELAPGLSGRDSLCWQATKKQMLTYRPSSHL